jgi:uncharacterized protein
MYASKYNFILESNGENIIFNPLSGAIDIIDKKDLEILEKIKSNKNMDEEILKQFVRRGYVFSDEESEKKQLYKMYSLYEKVTSKKERYVLCPTYACNLKCTYCFQTGLVKRTADLMSNKVLNKAFDAINNFHKERDSKEPFISLYGGEPFIAREKQMELTRNIIKLCEENGYSITATTNGVDLSKYVGIISNPVVKQVQITLDGVKEIHDKRRIFSDGRGTFDLIVKGIEDALENNIKIILRANVDSENIDYLPKLADFLIGKGWDKKVFTYLAPVKQYTTGKNTFCMPEYKVLEAVSEIYKNYPQTRILTLGGWQGVDTIMNLVNFKSLFPPQFKNCEANVHTFAFDLHGDVYTCLATCGENKFSVGKFYPKLKLNQNLVDIWRRRSIFTIEKCKDCKFNILCGGGCAILAYFGNGSIDKECCKPIEQALKIGVSLYMERLKEMSNAIH